MAVQEMLLESNKPPINKRRKTNKNDVALDLELPEDIHCCNNTSSSQFKPEITVILRNTELLLNKTRKRHEKHKTNSNSKLAHADDDPDGHHESIGPRPDITHHALMMLLDSPLNKVGLVKILLENVDGKIIHVNPSFRIPRTWKVFSKVISDFLSSPLGLLSAPDGGDDDAPLLKLLEPPLEAHIHQSKKETTAHIILEPNGRFCRLREIFPRLLEKHDSLIITIELPTSRKLRMRSSLNEYSETAHHLSISHYPISSMVVCNRLCNELERFVL